MYMLYQTVGFSPDYNKNGGILQGNTLYSGNM